MSAVVVRSEFYSIFVYILEHLVCEFTHLGLRIAHSSSAVSIDRTEVSLTNHQWITHREILRHLHHRIIDSYIAMWVIFTKHFSNYGCRFPSLRSGVQTNLIHRKENSTMYRLQSVAYIRQRTIGNNRHRVVDK